MNLIQANAALQVAQLKYDSDPNETTAQALASAKKYLEELEAPKENIKDADVETKAASDAKAKADAEAKAASDAKAKADAEAKAASDAKPKDDKKK